MKKIFYFPKPNNSNQYSNNTIKAIENAGDFSVVNAPTLKEFIKNPLKILRCNRADFVIVNWLESHLARKDGSFSLTGTFKFFSYLFLFKIIAKKIIYVRHNIYPHNMSGVSAKVVAKITDFSEKLCHLKVAHSGHLTSRGYQYIPHPLYSVRNDKQVENEDYYIIFGKIERYKNIESVILNWGNQHRLVVSGPVGDESYLEELRLIAKNRNVIFEARFIPDEEAAKLVSGSRGAIIAHSNRDMIVSGSFYYAMSLGIPIIAMRQPFLDWLVEHENLQSVTIIDDFNSLNLAVQSCDLIDTAHVLKEAFDNFGTERTTSHWKKVLNDS